MTGPPAYAELEEDRKGKLAPGMLADLAVLSEDIFTAAPGPLLATRSVLTMVGGRIVWDEGVVRGGSVRTREALAGEAVASGALLRQGRRSAPQSDQ